MMKHVLLIRNLNEEIAPEAYSLPPCKALRRARVLQRTSGAGWREQGRGLLLNANSTTCTAMGSLAGPHASGPERFRMNIYNVTEASVTSP
jgi:hypothetical protein